MSTTTDRNLIPTTTPLWTSTNDTPPTANVCVSYEQLYPQDALNSRSLMALVGLLYSSIWVTGVGGNLLVVYVCFTRRLAFSIRWTFVLMLAFSDLFVACTSLPITAINSFTRRWVFPEFFCYSIGFFQSGGIFLSSFTLCAISIDRYFLIVHPEKTVVTPATATLSLLAALALGLVLATPNTFWMTMETYEELCGQYCNELVSEEWKTARKWYSVAVMLLQFGLPSLTGTVCYWLIDRRLRHQIDRRLAKEVLLPAAERRMIDRRHRTTRMAAAIVATFVLAWLPFNLVNLARDFDEEFLLSDDLGLLSTIVHLVAMCSTIANPIIYCIATKPFRDGLSSLMGTGRHGAGVCCRRLYQRHQVLHAGSNTNTTSIPDDTLNINNNVRFHRVDKPSLFDDDQSRAV